MRVGKVFWRGVIGKILNGCRTIGRSTLVDLHGRLGRDKSYHSEVRNWSERGLGLHKLLLLDRNSWYLQSRKTFSIILTAALWGLYNNARFWCRRLRHCFRLLISCRDYSPMQVVRLLSWVYNRRLTLWGLYCRLRLCGSLCSNGMPLSRTKQLLVPPCASDTFKKW